MPDCCPSCSTSALHPDRAGACGPRRLCSCRAGTMVELASNQRSMSLSAVEYSLLDGIIISSILGASAKMTSRMPRSLGLVWAVGRIPRSFLRAGFATTRALSGCLRSTPRWAVFLVDGNVGIFLNKLHTNYTRTAIATKPIRRDYGCSVSSPSSSSKYFLTDSYPLEISNTLRFLLPLTGYFERRSRTITIL